MNTKHILKLKETIEAFHYELREHSYEVKKIVLLNKSDRENWLFQYTLSYIPAQYYTKQFH